MEGWRDMARQCVVRLTQVGALDDTSVALASEGAAGAVRHAQAGALSGASSGALRGQGIGIPGARLVLHHEVHEARLAEGQDRKSVV